MTIEGCYGCKSHDFWDKLLDMVGIDLKSRKMGFWGRTYTLASDGWMDENVASR